MIQAVVDQNQLVHTQIHQRQHVRKMPMGWWQKTLVSRSEDKELAAMVVHCTRPVAHEVHVCLS